MDPTRTAWCLGAAIVVLGGLYGVFWTQTREGLAALGGIVLMLMAGAAGALVTAGAAAWSARRRSPLPGPMLAVTFLLGLATAGIGAMLLLEAGGPLPTALAVTGLLATAAAAWAWRRPPALSTLSRNG